MAIRSGLYPVTILRPEDTDPVDDANCAAAEFGISETGSLIEIRYEGNLA